MRRAGAATSAPLTSVTAGISVGISKEPDSSTIPLTLNLRPTTKADWRLVETDGRLVKLEIAASAGKIMAQADCQHRLGHLADLPIVLPFMCFIGLSEREEIPIKQAVTCRIRKEKRGAARSLVIL
jgi:DNA sulfur modification protein DndB